MLASSEWVPVVSDAVKIGLPLILGGALTLFTIRITRRHTERNERQKRRQDALESLAMTLARLHEANEDHYLYCRDEYFSLKERTEPWLRGNLETLERMQRENAVLSERLLLVTVLGEELYGVFSEFFHAHNAVRRAYAAPGKTEDEIKAAETEATAVCHGLVRTIRARHDHI